MHGFCDAAAYLNTADTDAVIAEIVALFGAEGMRPVERPAKRLNDSAPLVNNLWAVTVFPGSDGWTVIISVPWELLCDRAEGADRNRFFELCQGLKAPGVLLTAHDGEPAWGKILAEADGRGGERACGWWYHGSDDKMYPQDALGKRFYGHEVRLASIEKQVSGFEAMRFELLPHLNMVLDDSQNVELHPFRGDSEFEVFFYYLGSQLGGGNGEFLNERRGELHDAMTRHAPMKVAEGTVLYFEWPAGDRPEPVPTARDLALERLMAEPRVFYADGSPVLEGDAVLYDHGMFPGLIAGFLVGSGVAGLEVTNVLVQAVEPGKRAHPASSVAEELQLVERGTRDFLKAGFGWLRKSARQGDAKSQFALGNLYLIGYGVAKDEDECLRWWRMAAAQGYAPAVERLDKDS